MRVIGQWDSLIQLLTTESAQELMGNSLSRLRLRGSAFNILVKEKKQKKKTRNIILLVDSMSFKYIFGLCPKSILHYNLSEP